jgi:hypothetical protein
VSEHASSQQQLIIPVQSTVAAEAHTNAAQPERVVVFEIVQRIVQAVSFQPDRAKSCQQPPENRLPGRIPIEILMAKLVNLVK